MIVGSGRALTEVGARAEVMIMDARFKALGFRVEDTGGGCEALWLQRPDGAYVLITDDNLALPKGGEPAVVGFYDDHGECERQITVSIIEACREVEAWLRAASKP